MARMMIELGEREFALFKELVSVYASPDSPAVDIATGGDSCGWEGAPYTMGEFASLKRSLDQAMAVAKAGK